MQTLAVGKIYFDHNMISCNSQLSVSADIKSTTGLEQGQLMASHMIRAGKNLDFRGGETFKISSQNFSLLGFM